MTQWQQVLSSSLIRKRLHGYTLFALNSCMQAIKNTADKNHVHVGIIWKLDTMRVEIACGRKWLLLITAAVFIIGVSTGVEKKKTVKFPKDQRMDAPFPPKITFSNSPDLPTGHLRPLGEFTMLLQTSRNKGLSESELKPIQNIDTVWRP